MLLIWLLLFGFVTKSFGRLFGIPYLFLDPEYIDKVDTISLIILGASFGAFSMSFQITNYILDSSRFSFLGTLRHPFGKFVINNSIIPLFFLIVYIISFYNFQVSSGFQETSLIVIEAIGFSLSYIGIHVLIYVYFSYTNKDIFKVVANTIDTSITKKQINKVNVMRQFKVNPFKKKNRVDSYFDLPFKFIHVDKTVVYDKEFISKVFDQNHLNAALIQIVGLISILFLGLFKDISYFQIPAAASAMILFSIFIMITGFLSYWLRGWAITGTILLLVFVNLFVKNQLFDTTYKAFGLNYETKPANYSLNRINALSSDENYLKDVDSTLLILKNWRAKFPVEKKPKMIFVCTSGGGQRAAVWVMRTLQVIDSSTHGRLFNNTSLITGASGGMVGASFFREYYLQKSQGKDVDIYSEDKFYNISKDVLNPVLFTFVVNDMFLRTQKFTFANNSYSKDRGYAFESQLNKNAGGCLWKKVTDYKSAEKSAQVPMLILSPTIINDGRKLIISAQNMSYMCTASLQTKKGLNNQRLKGIEFMRFYKEQGAQDLAFLSALRMSATFPYITPNVSLPSNPVMEIMDAGLADNFGFTDAVRFLYVFKDWIAENTSGVVFVSIRDSQKELEIEKTQGQSILQKAFTPIGSLYTSWDFLQDINNDNIIDYAKSWFKGDLDVVDFQYLPKPKYWQLIKDKNLDPEYIEKLQKSERASLSWHLTTREKESLKRTIFESNNQAALRKLKMILEEK